MRENKSPKKATDQKVKSPEEIVRDKRIRRNCFCCSAVLLVIIIFGGVSFYRFLKDDNNNANIPIFSNLVNKDNNQDNARDKTNSEADNTTNTTAPADESSPPADEPPPADTTPATTDNSKLIQFFIETALRDISGQHALGTCRWTKNPTTVGMAEGSLDSITSTELNNFIADFNSQSGTIKLAKVQGPGDIKIYYLPPDEVARLSNDLTDGGFNENVTGDNCAINEGRVYISNDPANAVDFKKYLIRHEMSHAIGFVGHSDLYGESIMAVAREGYSFSEVDKKAIQMLYNSNLPLCSRDSKIKELYQ